MKLGEYKYLTHETEHPQRKQREKALHNGFVEMPTENLKDWAKELRARFMTVDVINNRADAIAVIRAYYGR